MKLYVFFVLLLIYGATVEGQDLSERRFTATAVAGVNGAQVDGDGFAGYDKVGLNVGARGGIILSQKVELGLEILFSQQGSQSKRQRGLPLAYRASLNYIEVPLLFYFKDWEVTNEKKDTYYRVMVGGGASFNRLLGGRVENNGLIEFEGGTLFTDGGFKQNHIALIADVNFFFTRNWGVNLRYTRAPMNIRKNILYNPHMFSIRALFAL